MIEVILSRADLRSKLPQAEKGMMEFKKRRNLKLEYAKSEIEANGRKTRTKFGGFAPCEK